MFRLWATGDSLPLNDCGRTAALSSWYLSATGRLRATWQSVLGLWSVTVLRPDKETTFHMSPFAEEVSAQYHLSYGSPGTFYVPGQQGG